jgi:hypothetical protein
MPDATVDGQLLHQPQEPTHRTRRFDSHDNGPRNRGIKLSYRLTFVRQRLFDDRSGVAIQHRNRLLARM